MSDVNYLNDFQEPNGSTTREGQTNAGNYEKSQGFQPAPQQSTESREAYEDRLKAATS